MKRISTAIVPSPSTLFTAFLLTFAILTAPLASIAADPVQSTRPAALKPEPDSRSGPAAEPGAGGFLPKVATAHGPAGRRAVAECYASTLVVTSNVDDGSPGTLRDAI